MVEQSRNYRISISQGMSGYYAVLTAEFYDGQSWYTDLINTGIGRYKTREEAIKEALLWAESEELTSGKKIKKDVQK